MSLNDDLYNAARYRNLVEIKTAIAAGADPNHADEVGKTSLSFAAEYGSLDAVITLLAAGADPSVGGPDHNPIVLANPMVYLKEDQKRKYEDIQKALRFVMVFTGKNNANVNQNLEHSARNLREAACDANNANDKIFCMLRALTKDFNLGLLTEAGAASIHYSDNPLLSGFKEIFGDHIASMSREYRELHQATLGLALVNNRLKVSADQGGELPPPLPTELVEVTAKWVASLKYTPEPQRNTQDQASQAAAGHAPKQRIAGVVDPTVMGR